MPITESQRKRRVNHLGSSDLYEMLFGNAYAVWLSKVQAMEDLDHSYLKAGNYIEKALMEYCRDELGPITQNQYRKVDGAPIGVNIDAIVNESGNPVEGKGALNCATARGWGEPGTDEMPTRVIVQGHGHMLATGKKLCHVPACLVSGHLKFAMFHVERDDQLAQVLMDRSNVFWHEYVVPRREPDDSWTISTAPALKDLQRVIREPGKIVQCVDEKILPRFELVKQLEAFCKAEKDALKARMMAAMGDGDTLEFPDGRRYWLKPIKGTKFDKARLDADHPGFVKQYTNANPYTKGEIVEPKPELEAKP